MPVIVTGVGYLIFYIATGCFNMNDPADSDSDEFFDATEDRPEQDSMMAQSVEKRVESLEKQMACLSGQMETIVEKLEGIGAMLESRSGSVPDEKTRRYSL